MAEKYYDSTLTGEELDEALRSIPENMRRSEAAAKAAESWAQGGTHTREGEDTDNAAYWAKQARADAGTASAGAQTVADNQEALQAVKDNLAAIQGAARNAERAEAAAESAGTDAERAEAAAKLAQSIAQGQKGYYATPELLRAAFPTGAAGDWAIVGSTDTVWVWDDETGGWLNSGNNIDLSNYDTKDEVDDKLDELQAALGQQISETQETLGRQITGAASRTWTVAVAADAWQAGSAAWAGITAGFKATVACAGMTADTVLAPPQYADGDLASAQAFAWAESGAGAVTLWSETKPAAAFALTLTEVK